MLKYERLLKEVVEANNAERVLDEVLNPPWVQERAKEVFPGNPEARKLLKTCRRFEWKYQTVGPAGLPECDWGDVTRLAGRSITLDLKAHVLLPSHIAEATEPIIVQPNVSYHGGAALMGNVLFEDWIYTKELQGMFAHGMISIHPEYCLMPQADSEVLRGNRTALLTWLFCELQPNLSAINANITVDWSNFYCCSGSFGGHMAIKTWTEHHQHEHKPQEFCFRKMALRYPITGDYKSEEDKFMGLDLDRKEVLSDLDKVLAATRSTRWLYPRASTDPPSYMKLARLLRELGLWGSFYNGVSPYDTIKALKECPDERTEWYTVHGSEDRHVNMNDTIRFLDFLTTKWPIKSQLEIQPGKAHAGDYTDPLSEAHQKFLWGS